MLLNILRTRSRRREDTRLNEVAAIMDKLGGFGATRPLKDQIAALRVLRDTGVLKHADYEVRVADLLGSPGGTADHLAARTRAA